MALYVIGDLHLSLATEKPMDIFSGWENYVEKLKNNWCSKITAQDTVVVAGDISWAMSLEESLTDMRFLNELPGKKVILKGNHDYWWTTATKMERFFSEHCLDTLAILHNNCIAAEGAILCGTRGWMFEKGQAQDQKIVAREAQRLEVSLKAAEKCDGEKIVFLHYPPLFGEEVLLPFLELMRQYGVKRCYYGHIHGSGCQFAYNGPFRGIQFRLISGDFIGFDPVKIN